MKNFIKQSAFLAIIAFTFIFTACESNEDTLPIEEQNQIEAIDPSKIVDLNTLLDKGTKTDARLRLSFAMKGYNGKYVSSENGNKAMTCNRPSAGSWEKFEFEPHPTISNAYYLKGNNERYVRRQSGSPFLRSFVHKNHAELFHFISASNNKYYLYSHTARRYVLVEPNGYNYVTCHSRYPTSNGALFSLYFFIE